MPYILNGQNADIGEEPFEQDGKHYVPLDPIVRQLGGTINWNNETKVAQATIGQWTATVQMANSTVDVNGQQVTLSAPPFVENDTMYVPWDFFHAAYGYKAEMNGDTLSIHL